MPIGNRQTACSLIGSVFFADWSLYVGKPCPLGPDPIVVAIALAAIWGATEWTALRLGFQAQLGAPWFELDGWPFDYPPIFFWWGYAYDAYVPSIFIERAFIAASGGFLSIAVAISLSVWRAREAKSVATYGSLRWASPEEVKAAGPLGPDGVVLGRRSRLSTPRRTEHVL